MHVARVTERISSFGIGLFRSSFFAALAGGTLIGVLAVSTWLPWTLTWGDDPAFSAAALVMLTLGIHAGSRTRRMIPLGSSLSGLVACGWTLLLPIAMRNVASTLEFMPVDALAGMPLRTVVAFGCATTIWFVAGMVGSHFALTLNECVALRGLGRFSFSPAVAFGAACGLAISTFFLAPLIGAWFVALAELTVVGFVWAFPRKSGAREDSTAIPSESGRIRPLIAAVKNSGADTTRFAETLSVVAAIGLGGLLAAVMRLVGELMPNGIQVLAAEWIGLLIGFSAGQVLVRFRAKPSRLDSGLVMLAAASSAMLLAGMPMLVDLSLHMTASLTWVAFMMSFRVLLLAVSVAPLGMAFASLFPSDGDDFVTSSDALSGWRFLTLSLGFVAAQSCFETAGLIAPMAVCCLILVCVGTTRLLLQPGPGSLSWRTSGAMATIALLGVSVPLWSSHDDPARVEKLLFSTPSFVAHRSGWETELLPMLDDARMIAESEGPRGHLTLWRSHGAELHLRQNGIPRGVISANTEMYPQFPPEVLQAVFPLVIADRPDRVLILGASGGVPLATCLQFPVRQVVCAEGDAALIAMLRGPLAKETAYDPFADDRVRLLAVPPEVALMGRDEPYDVILSSPSSSSIVAGAAVFTTEYYRRASQRLTERGVFCQRFECIDYGPDPLLRVVQSMRQAFREVIAIETVAGEMMLLATNADGVFVPDDLPARLEASHVRRLLARSGLDWSSLLNFPTYDHAALGEVCAESRTRINTPGNGLLALRAPLELMRWGAKLQETQQVLTAIRTTDAPFWNRDGRANLLEGEVHLSRQSRLLEWLGDRGMSPDVIRRLSEVATQHKLVRENVESPFHNWEYRTALKAQMQKRPLSVVKQVAHSSDEQPMLPENQRRKDYFTALGTAYQQTNPTREQIAAVEACLEPYDPLLSYFARHEIADLQARSKLDPASEFAHRMHLIYFATAGDGYSRNVAMAIELLVRAPEAIPDPARRFDILNGLVQTMRTRWESRQGVPVKSARRQISDIDRSVIAVEKAVDAMNGLYGLSSLSEADWSNRKQVIDRLLLRPLRTYRTQLQASLSKSEMRTREIIEAAAHGDE